jgi:hypothetical protein
MRLLDPLVANIYCFYYFLVFALIALPSSLTQGEDALCRLSIALTPLLYNSLLSILLFLFQALATPHLLSCIS